VNQAIMRAEGYIKEVERFSQGLCATCGSDATKPSDFRELASQTEYGISGMCQHCQDKVLDGCDD
jgi:hypothetical protein